MPASVYMTVSRSGETKRSQCSKSSPVFTTAVSAAGGRKAASPSRRRAPPTPPASATTRPRHRVCSGIEVLRGRTKELARGAVTGRERKAADVDRRSPLGGLAGHQVGRGGDLIGQCGHRVTQLA